VDVFWDTVYIHTYVGIEKPRITADLQRHPLHYKFSMLSSKRVGLSFAKILQETDRELGGE